MFTGATNVSVPMNYCEIPANFGGGGGGTCSHFGIINATSVTPRWTVTGSALEYRVGTGNWTPATSGTAIIKSANDIIRFRGSGRTTLFTGNVNTNAWTINGSNVILIGNLNTLLDYTTPPLTVGTNCFRSLFEGCTSIVNANIVLPATSFNGNNCYAGMFTNCTNLVSFTFELPAMTMTVSTYYGMFQGCTNLTTVPALPATTLNNQCYQLMFDGCVNIINAPELLAASLPNNCYGSMFNRCEKLISAPNSDVYTAKTPSQSNMFSGCTALTTPLTYAQIPAGWK
jgi:hypothetical protein